MSCRGPLGHPRVWLFVGLLRLSLWLFVRAAVSLVFFSVACGLSWCSFALCPMASLVAALAELRACRRTGTCRKLAGRVKTYSKKRPSIIGTLTDSGVSVLHPYVFNLGGFRAIGAPSRVTKPFEFQASSFAIGVRSWTLTC